MAKWMSFKRDFDYRHPSRAVTAYKAGMVEYVPNKVAEAVIEAGAAVEAEKPADRDGRAWLNG